MFSVQGPNSTIPVPAAQDQIDAYLATGSVKSTDIVTVFIGANDAFFSSNVTGAQISGLVADQVAQLYKHGEGRLVLFELRKVC